MGVTVLVTGAGGPAGVGVIRALRSAGTRVVAADVDPAAVGFHLADEHATIPRAEDPGLVDGIAELALASGATALVVTVAEELVALAGGTGTLHDAGLATWFPPAASVTTCLDKWAFARAVRDGDVTVPATNLGTADGVPGPWIVKPRFGRGSRHVIPADDREDLEYALRHVPDAIVQTRLEGREFTVDALVDRDGRLAAAVPRWREETRGGISTRGTTFADERVTAGVASLLGLLALDGPSNVQGFVAPGGAPAFTEVNPRFSGGLPLSLAAGADLVGEVVRGTLGLPLRPERLVYRVGVSMRRYFDEVFT